MLFKGHSFLKQCLHDLQFKNKVLLTKLSKLARADISCQFKKTRYLCRHCSALFTKRMNFREHPFKTSTCLRGGGVKNLPNLPTDITKKLPMVGG